MRIFRTGAPTGALLRAALTTAALVLPASGFAATDIKNVVSDFIVTGWGQKDGLPPGTVNDLAQDQDGYLWVGTTQGLYRFDGAQLVPWNSLGLPLLPNSGVLTVSRDKDGDVWVAFAGRPPVLARLRGATVQTFSAQDGFDGSTPNFLLSDRTGMLLMGTSSGLHYLQNGHWMRWDGQGLPAGAVLSAALDTGGALFVGTSRGIFKRLPGADAFLVVEDFHRSVSRLWDEIPQALAEFDGRMWVTDPDVGYRVAGSERRIAASAERGSGRSLLRDRAGTLWVGSGGQGLWRVRPSLAPDAPVERLTTATGLMGEAANALLEDREGNIWVGTTEGLNRLTPNKTGRITNIGLVVGLESAPENSVWVATADDLRRYQPASVDQPRSLIRMPDNVRIQAFHRDASGNLWIATNRGLTRLDSNGVRPIALAGTESLQHITMITSDARGGAWVYDDVAGLHRWSGGTLQPFVLSAAAGSTVLWLHTDHDGSLWLDLGDGQLARVNRAGDIRFFGEADGVAAGGSYASYEDAAGTFWIAGARGLSRLHDSRFEMVVRFPAAIVANPTALVQDASGTFWVGSGLGIVRLDPDDFRRSLADPQVRVGYRRFGRAEGLAGLPSPSSASRRVLRTEDGDLWFATGRGIAILHPSSLPDTDVPAPVHVETVLVNDRVLRVPADLELPADTSRLEIKYTALNMTSPQRVRFKYKLEGFDADWNEAGTRRQAFYTNLPPRAYRFVVAATSDDGAWPENEAAWAFSIAPRFYQTIWFYVLVLATLSLCVYGAWQMRVRHIRAQFSLVLGERARVSREIHDTLLQSLVGLALQFDVMTHELQPEAQAVRERFLRMRKRLEQYIREARRSIAQLRTSQIAEVDLVDTLREAALAIIDTQPIAFDLTVEGAPPPTAFGVQEQLVRIAQEAMTNAVRHGHPTRLHVDMKYDGHVLQLAIADNGCGFDPSRVVDDQHFGLVTMQERASELHAELVINSRPQQGTTVTLQAPLG